MGLITAFPRYNWRGKRAGMTYKLNHLSDSRSPKDDSATGHQKSDSKPLSDIRSPIVTTTGHQESDSKPHDSCMMNDEDIKRKKLDLLDFFSQPGRSYRAAQCTLEEARAWRAFKDYCDTNELWTALGVKENPIGWIYRLMENNQPPPPLQIPLPAGSFEVPAFTSRGMTREEIEAQHNPGDGATLGEDGIWR